MSIRLNNHNDHGSKNYKKERKKNQGWYVRGGQNTTKFKMSTKTNNHENLFLAMIKTF